MSLEDCMRVAHHYTRVVYMVQGPHTKSHSLHTAEITACDSHTEACDPHTLSEVYMRPVRSQHATRMLPQPDMEGYFCLCPNPQPPPFL